MTGLPVRLEDAVSRVEASPDYKVLRRFVPDPAIYLGASFAAPPECKTGLFVDVETEGLDQTHQVIEFSAVPFTFDPDGIVYDAGKGLSFFRDPGRPLERRIVELTGITDEMVKGQRIDTAAVEALAAEAVLIIAHRADFDRKRVEHLLPIFRDKAWGCSHREVPWEERHTRCPDCQRKGPAA